ncbi:DUF3604 domain-containing protein [Luminiphilus sp. nBUS_07]|uniref:DUF3604 domain-containing protein n=1 Tax=Luminiphilus sp. nBUS_07 TaxID=3395314 RepID=UPI003EB8ABD3
MIVKNLYPALWLLTVTLASFSQAEDRQLLWGDTHLHTTYSSDAFANNNLTATPDMAYRFAKGAPVVHGWDGRRVQLETPLDFLVVSDHAELMGVIRSVYYDGVTRDDLSLIDSAKAWIATAILRDAVDQQTARNLFLGVLPEPTDDFAAAARDWDADVGWIPDLPAVEADAWKAITDAADAHNAPGDFTALIGWEYSAIPGGANLHRVVIGDIDAQTAQTFVPYGLDNSSFPEDLWEWLESTAKSTGGTFLAIPHNSNISKGIMFDLTSLRGDKMDTRYAELRRYWEPVVEITQIKGDSETHSSLSPEDEFADFENYPFYIQKWWTEYQPQPGDFVRSALRRGLTLEADVGINPYQFGVIGSTDGHTALPSAEEANFQGKFVTDSIPSKKSSGWGDEPQRPFGWAMSASGLAAVWAEDNTREGIVAAMRRREVYATTGPRIGVRVYGGWNLSAESLEEADFPANVLEQAVPMGGELMTAAEGATPTLLIEALADPASGALDRIQVIKGWTESDGGTQEQVYDVAWAGEGRLQTDGSLLPVENTVDLATGLVDNSVGAGRLTAAWSDPNFDPDQSAFYYVRVLQIPTARHSLLDKLALGGEVDTQRPDTLQERAYTSSIWYRP